MLLTSSFDNSLKQHCAFVKHYFPHVLNLKRNLINLQHEQCRLSYQTQVITIISNHANRSGIVVAHWSCNEVSGCSGPDKYRYNSRFCYSTHPTQYTLNDFSLVLLFPVRVLVQRQNAVKIEKHNKGFAIVLSSLIVALP